MILMVIDGIDNDTDKQFMLHLYYRYRNLMVATARKFVTDSFAVEDILQDALIRLIPKISQLRQLEPLSLNSYIFYTVRTTALDYLKKKSTEDKHISFVESDQLLRSAKSTDRMVEEKAEELDSGARLYEAISRLESADRELLVRKYYFKQSDPEIADAFGCKPSSVRMKLTRARRNAYAFMEREGITYESL